VFAVALLASGLSSSGVGTLAGQIVMGSIGRRRVPVFVRRAITAGPAMVILACHVPLIEAVLVSQAVLSFGIPFAVIPLFALSADRRVMGPLVTRPIVQAAGGLVAAALVALNAVLLAQTL
jgi:manganese transport protein